MSTTNKQHPKAIAAAQVALHRSLARNQQKETVKLAKSNGIRFEQVGTTTLAVKRYHDVIEFSTAVFNNNDRRFDPIYGRCLAAERWMRGETVQLKVANYHVFLRALSAGISRKADFPVLRYDTKE